MDQLGPLFEERLQAEAEFDFIVLARMFAQRPDAPLLEQVETQTAVEVAYHHLTQAYVAYNLALDRSKRGTAMARSGKLSTTTRDLRIDYHGCRFTLPRGTQVQQIMGGSGTGDPNPWAVRSSRLVMDLTGDTHTPKYYYCWVPADAVAA